MDFDPAKDVVYFGRTDFRNTNRLFGVKRTDRRQHMYVVGKTGTGKSALLNNMIVQDISNGEGVCVVDPHGELVEGILEKVPEKRLNDVIYVNPADTEYHIGFNVLELPDPKYKHLVASGLMGIFTKIWANVWSARMEYIMNNAILALLDTPGSTLLGVIRILVDKDYRQQIIANVQDPVVKAFWVHEFEAWRDQFRNEAIAPIQNKVGQFLSTSIIRNIVGQSRSTIDIFQLMNEGKILLINVSKGRIGEDNSALLGAMFITKIQLAAMERIRVPEDERVDFYLYVDEFQNFATDSFAGILSESRKYRLDLILAHQYIGQLVTDVSTKVRDAIFGNVGTMIIFRVGATDAEFLESEFEPEFMPQDIVNLPNYAVYLKLMVDGVTSRPFSAATLPPFKMTVAETTKETIIRNSQKRYARPAAVVEDEINRWSGVMASAEGAAPSAGLSGRDGTYIATCSSCGKTTTVPFAPDPSRPIYCKDCLNRVKAGEILPVKLPRVQKKIRDSSKDALAAVGIEFEMQPKGKEEIEEPEVEAAVIEEREEAKPPMQPPAEAAPPPTLAVQEMPVPETPKTDVPAAVLPEAKPEAAPAPTGMSLADLKPPKKTHHIIKERSTPQVDVDELRKSISASLDQILNQEKKEE
ncbi:MAG: type IV secretion system DNA-binding domain-containing protein [Candidatus Liptonbacteria bacterium]|nr:type IV secretion system DNA-binding domain-containing protein [Candidatus Liptonbacteria bacterium]